MPQHAFPPAPRIAANAERSQVQTQPMRRQQPLRSNQTVVQIPPKTISVASPHVPRQLAKHAIANRAAAIPPVGPKEAAPKAFRISVARFHTLHTDRNAHPGTIRVRYAKSLRARSGRKFRWYSSQIDSFIF